MKKMDANNLHHAASNLRQSMMTIGRDEPDTESQNQLVQAVQEMNSVIRRLAMICNRATDESS